MNTPSALVCREIRLRQFRNFAELDLRFPTAGAAIIGDNGSGKTNLLEALHYLEILRSFRGAADEQLVRFGADAFYVRGRFEDPASGVSLEIEAGYEPRTRRKRVTVNGAEVERLGDAIGRLGTVIFSPSDVAIVTGAPNERRRYLDIILSLNVRGYMEDLQRYRHVLRQRNAILRDGGSHDVLAVWDQGLIDSGARIMAARAAWIAAHTARFAEIYRIIGDGAQGRIEYDADVPFESEDTITAAFGARLERVAGRERERRITLAGPHRDDLSIRMHTADNEVDLREFGSGGQARTGAIALRMIEAETVREARGAQPLLLLDDVFAELDAGRSRRIIDLFARDGHGQVILTAPKETDVVIDQADDRGAVPLDRWRIAAALVST